MRPRILVLATIGALLCTALDYLHATHGVLAYPKTELGAQSWWVPLLFFNASIVVLLSARLFRDGSAKERARGVDVRHVIATGSAFAIAYASTSFFHDSPRALLAGLVGLWIARMAGPEGSLRLVVFSLVCGIAGPLFEASWSGLGFFHYASPELLGVPLWLAGIYLHLAPFAVALDRAFLVHAPLRSGRPVEAD